MLSQAQEPKTLQEAILYFSDANRCLDYLALRRWPDGMPICPVCGRKDAKFLANQRKWQCKSVHHHRQFSVKVGSIFEDSPIPLQKWLPAVWVIVNCKNGISSYELHRALRVTQKTAWFMLHRIRLGMQLLGKGKIGGPGSEIEVDETFMVAKRETCTSQNGNALDMASECKADTAKLWSWECLSAAEKSELP
jgi:hypothetical protein